MSEPSGPQWCCRYPTSKFIGDLLPDFRECVGRFLQALKDAGATVTVNATYRPSERAWLMHWCCMIGGGGQDPAHVPALSGIDIDWAHGDDFATAKAAAKAMMAEYGIVYPAALESRHTQRRAIDMTISWNGTLSIRDFDGNMHNIASIPCGGTNPELARVGASFGVVKLATDPPHWSQDGH